MGVFVEQTLSIIKPDATKRNITGKINSMIEGKGLRIIAQKRIQLDLQMAESFYSVHKDRPFFKDLCDYMISGPVVVQVLQAKNAVSLYRELMGSTDPSNASDGTIRKAVAIGIQENSVHGSDSLDSALEEINFFFKKNEIVE
jgi:nucleoside-diphosphate kinase